MAQYGQFGLFGKQKKGSRTPMESHAFGEIVRVLMPGLLARATQALHSRDQARDAVQESLLIAYTRLDQLRSAESFPAWLKAIVDSQCSRILRKRSREISLEGLERFEPLAPKSMDPATSYEWLSFRAAANQAFEQLSEPLRAPSRLYYETGHTVCEIADILSLKKGTVRKRLHDAQAHLVELLSCHVVETSIRVGYLSISDHLLGMVAHRLGKGRDSRVRMKRFMSWSVLAEALVQRRIDAAFIMAPLAMQLCNSGTPLRYILDGHHDGSALAASTTTLQGKLVGVPGPYSTHRVLLGKLAHEIPHIWNNISTADTNPSYAIQSLKSQVIDAFFCAEPWSTKCVSEGGADLFIRSKDVAPGHPCCVVAVHAEFCRDHPALVHEYVRLLLRARDMLRSDIAYCAKTQSMYTGVGCDLATRVLEEGVVTFDNLRPDKQRMAEFMQLALDSGVLSSPCDLDRFVCTDFI